MARVGVYHRTKESVIGGGGGKGWSGGFWLCHNSICLVLPYGFVVFRIPPLPLIGHQFSVVYSLYILL